MLYGGIEAGGTKFILTVAESPTAPSVETISIPTTTPDETIGKSIEFFRKHKLSALGIASFGPVDLKPGSPTYGYVTATPKPGWQNTDVRSPFLQEFNIPIGFDTDVNAAALGEWRYGAAQGVDSVAYMTIGTGIGGGAIINGQMLHGLVHPEQGHITVRRHPDDQFEGHCPYHKDCLEGMACGPAIQARWGKTASHLPPDHQAWEFESYYLAQAICTWVYILSPQKIILGGGVMHQQHLFPRIRQYVQQLLNNYIQTPSITTEAINTFIIPPGLPDRSGAVGALELAYLAATT